MCACVCIKRVRQRQRQTLLAWLQTMHTVKCPYFLSYITDPSIVLLDILMSLPSVLVPGYEPCPPSVVGYSPHVMMPPLVVSNQLVLYKKVGGASLHALSTWAFTVAYLV